MSKLDYFAIGTYTDYVTNAPFACGDGISIISLDVESGDLKIVSQYKNVINPTYLDWSEKKKRLYCCSENGDISPNIYSFAIEEDKSIKLLAKSNKSEESLCYISSLKTSNTIFSASYTGGCYYKYMDNDNSVDISYKHTYKGISHAHQTVADINEKYLYICDLGNDKIWIDDVNHGSEETSSRFLNLTKGYGPRHLVFDLKGEYAYILCELTPVLIVVKVNPLDGSLNIIREYSTTFNTDISKSAPAAIKIHPSGKTLALSNRVDNTIAIFRINNDELELVDEFSTKGDHPRDITFTKDGDWLLIANQNTSNIQTISFNPKTGEPNSIWGTTLKIGTPVCIVNV